MWLVTSLLVTSCTKKYNASSGDTNRSLNRIHLAVKYSIKNSIKKRSQNTRVYYSHYHIPGTDPNARAVNKKRRGQVTVTINGDRRPYNVVYNYRIERLNGKKYIFDRYDKRLAQKYLDRFNEFLDSRPEQRDVIDEFRPY